MAPASSLHKVTFVLVVLVLPKYLDCRLVSRFGVQFFDSDSDFHLFEEIDDACRNRDFSKMLMTVVKESTCSKPTETYVRLISDDDNWQFLPSHVKVKRCAGDCMAAQSCLPDKDKKEMISVPVRRLNRATNEITCGTVDVEQHTSCMCKCSVMEHHCNSNLQVYKPNDCMCECLNVEKKYDCLQEGKVWNMNRCSCECDEDQECSTGLAWVPSHCRCMKVSN